MPVLGAGAIWAAWIAAVLGIAAYLVYRRSREEVYARWVRALALVMGFMAGTAVLTLWVLLLEGDFHVLYVAQETSRETPILFRLTGLWSGNAGSLLLWASVLSGYVVWAALHRRPSDEGELTLHALPIMLVVAAFFFGILAFVTPPFATTPLGLYDGMGPNSLLQNTTMAIHPPLLYAGFVGLTLPFALGMASLTIHRQDATWIRLSRSTTTFSWLLLGVGILLGAHWAYTELGWGGYWAWDPVENASLLPWLTTTALLHGLLVRERRGILRAWTMIMLSISFWLTIFGTYLTRSGLLDSVHTFAGTGMGAYFGPFLGLGVLATAAQLVAHRGELRARPGEEERRPKESAVLVNNLIILAAAMGILVGTILPILSAPILGHPMALGSSGFNRMVTPLAAMAFLVLGVATTMGWGGESVRQLSLRLIFPAAVALAVAAVLYGAGVHNLTVWGIATTGVFALSAIAADVARIVSARRRSTGERLSVSLGHLVTAQRRMMGAYIVHVSVVIIVTGIAASSVYGHEVVATLAPGQTVTVAGYRMRYEGMHLAFPGDQQVLTATLAVSKGGTQRRISPSEVLFPGGSGPIAGVSILSSLGSDLYTVLEAIIPQGNGAPLVTFEVFVNPLVDLIWLGGLLFLFGGIWLWWPTKARQSAAHRKEEGVAA